MNDKINHLYISGPMSAYKNYNRPLFNAVARALRDAGYEVTNPAEVDLGEDATWQDYIAHAKEQLPKCDAVAAIFADGYYRSDGCLIEQRLAAKHDIPIHYWVKWYEKPYMDELREEEKQWQKLA